MFLGKSSVFSYCICKRELLGCEAVKVRVGEYHVYTNRNTHFEYREDPDVSLFVIGIAACLNTGESALDWLWKHKQSITSIVEAEKFLGGKYVLFIRIKDSYFILGDATCSIPVFYAKCDDGAICSSIGYQIAEEQGLSVDSALLEIREGGDSSRTMPYDYTIWKGIKRLLPNHYLDVNRMCVIRMVNQPVLLSPQSAEQAAEISLPFIKRLAEYYMRKFSVACALTSGRDSRAVLSVLGCSKDIPIYTMKHNEFAENTPDIVVPKQIAARVNLDYHQINDVDLTDKDIAEADGLLGEGNYSKRTLMLAHTINKHFGNYAVINGDIIGQVGKCSLHRDIPLCYATPSYFLCKLHNYTKGAKVALRKWLLDIRKTEEKVNSFDLFSIENRMGVWAANENEIYNVVGQYYLNIFNSRSIIYEWTRVDRKERKLSAIHIAIIRSLCPELLEIPFEPAGVCERMLKYNGLTYLIASYLKHYFEKIKKR